LGSREKGMGARKKTNTTSNIAICWLVPPCDFETQTCPDDSTVDPPWGAVMLE